MTITDPPTAPPLSLAGPWGGTGRVTDLGLAGRAPVHWVDFGGPEETAGASGDRDQAPVLLVHGLGGSHLNWTLLAPMLRQGRQVYAVDLAGFGLTPGGDQASTVQANVELVARFVETVAGRPVVLVGNSMGGMISLLLTSAHPELVDRLVLLDPSIPTLRRNLDRRVAATFLLYGIPRVGEAFIGQVTARMNNERRVADTTNLCFADPTRADPEVLHASVQLLAHRRRHAPDAEPAYLAAARSIMRVLSQPKRYRALMNDIDVPVLLIHGERDRLVPVAAARSTAAAHPAWTSVILPDVGHTPMLEKPEVVAGLVEEWLAGRASPDELERPWESHLLSTHPQEVTDMFRDTKAFSGFAVPDIAAAKAFYGDTLGIDVSEENGILTLHLAGGRDTIVYPKPDHVPATYTVLNFPVEDVESAVDMLAAKGVRFERYEGSGVETDAKGIMRQGGPLIAWFTDPAGNILSVIEG